MLPSRQLFALFFVLYSTACALHTAFADAPLDPSFSYDGRPYVYPIDVTSQAEVAGIAQDSQGHLVTAGYIQTGSNPYNFLISRHGLSPPGVLDPSFNSNGFAFNPFGTLSPSEATSIAVDHHGRIVAAGGWTLFRSCGAVMSSPTTYFVVARFLNDGGADDGKPDPSFGSGLPSGTNAVQVGNCDGTGPATGLAIGADDSVTVVGRAWDGLHNMPAVVRWTSTGTLDTSFGIGGSVMLSYNDHDAFGQAVAIDDEGRTLIAAYALTRSPNTALVFRLTTDGALDMTFASSGIAQLDFLGPGGSVCCIAIDDESNIVIAGEADTKTDTDRLFVARLDHSGNIDRTFGLSGFSRPAISMSDSGSSGLTIDNKGRPLVAGYSADFDYGVATLVHFNRDGSLNAAVGFDGVFTTPLGLDSSFATSVLVDSYGRPNVTVGARDRDGSIPVLIRYDELFGDGFD